MNKFLWQLCSSALSINIVEEWIQYGSFPLLVESNSIIEGVGNGKIGTDDDMILDEIVAPIGNRALIIKVGWPKGEHPGSLIKIYPEDGQMDKNKRFLYARLRV